VWGSEEDGLGLGKWRLISLRDKTNLVRRAFFPKRFSITTRGQGRGRIDWRLHLFSDVPRIHIVQVIRMTDRRGQTVPLYFLHVHLTQIYLLFSKVLSQ
jgi:hypothetical protein